MTWKGGAAIAAAFALLLANAASAETLAERGAYLVTTIAACGNCHTPRDASGQPIAGMALAGGYEFDAPDLGHIVTPNITPDADTGIGSWTEEQIVAALRNGKRPDGSIISPPMGIAIYRQLSDHDVAAVAAYLHGLKPIHHLVSGKSQLKIPAPKGYGPPVTHVAEPPRDDPVAYGHYLAVIGHCIFCHTLSKGHGQLDASRLGGGGRVLSDGAHSGGLTISRNITPDPDDGIGKWSDADIKHTITTGIRPDGTRLSRTMPFDWFAKMNPADLDDIVTYLRTLKPLKSAGDNG